MKFGKKILALGLMGVLALSVLAGCGSTGGTVSTDGSTSMEKVIGALKETFESENKSISVTYNPTGSGSGITAVAEGRCDTVVGQYSALKSLCDLLILQVTAGKTDVAAPLPHRLRLRNYGGGGGALRHRSFQP